MDPTWGCYIQLVLQYTHQGLAECTTPHPHRSVLTSSHAPLLTLTISKSLPRSFHTGRPIRYRECRLPASEWLCPKLHGWNKCNSLVYSSFWDLYIWSHILMRFWSESRDIELLYILYSCQNTVLMCSNAVAALWKLLPNAPIHVSFAVAKAVSGRLDNEANRI